MNGDPFQVDIQWPKFKLKAGVQASTLRGREQVINELGDIVAEESAKVLQPSRVTSELAYVYDEESQAFEPTLMVNVFGSDHKTPPHIVYSLVDGNKAKKKQVESGNY